MKSVHMYVFPAPVPSVGGRGCGGSAKGISSLQPDSLLPPPPAPTPQAAGLHIAALLRLAGEKAGIHVAFILGIAEREGWPEDGRRRTHPRPPPPRRFGCHVKEAAVAVNGDRGSCGTHGRKRGEGATTCPVGRSRRGWTQRLDAAKHGVRVHGGHRGRAQWRQGGPVLRPSRPYHAAPRAKHRHEMVGLAESPSPPPAPGTGVVPTCRPPPPFLVSIAPVPASPPRPSHFPLGRPPRPLLHTLPPLEQGQEQGQRGTAARGARRHRLRPHDHDGGRAPPALGAPPALPPLVGLGGGRRVRPAVRFGAVGGVGRRGQRQQRQLHGDGRTTGNGLRGQKGKGGGRGNEQGGGEGGSKK